MTIPKATTPTKTPINCHFRTFFRIIISGKDRPMTDIIKASAVPSVTPFSIKTLTMGMIPAAFEYRGMPTRIARGTEYQF